MDGFGSVNSVCSVGRFPRNPVPLTFLRFPTSQGLGEGGEVGIGEGAVAEGAVHLDGEA